MEFGKSKQKSLSALGVFTSAFCSVNLSVWFTLQKLLLERKQKKKSLSIVRWLLGYLKGRFVIGFKSSHCPVRKLILRMESSHFLTQNSQFSNKCAFLYQGQPVFMSLDIVFKGHWCTGNLLLKKKKETRKMNRNKGTAE